MTTQQAAQHQNPHQQVRYGGMFCHAEPEEGDLQQFRCRSEKCRHKLFFKGFITQGCWIEVKCQFCNTINYFEPSRIQADREGGVFP